MSKDSVNPCARHCLRRNAAFRFSGRIAKIVTGAMSTIILLNAGYCSSSTDYFRSKASGYWSDKNTWQSSVNGISWLNATLVPTSSARGVTIQSGTTVTLKAFTYPTGKMVTVAAGAILKDEVATVFIFGYIASGFNIIGDGTSAPDLVINGTYIINGAQPTLTNATVLVNGTVRADNNQLSGFFGTYDESDDFAYNSNVTFSSGAVFEWNNTSSFETAGITYFPNAAVGTTPIFSVDQSVTVGSSSATTINGKFEVSSGTTVTFQNNGTKTFRDGLGGSGIIIHDNTSGTFLLTGTSAVVDGSLTLNLYHNNAATDDLEVASGATLTVSGTPVVKVGSATYKPGSLLISGTLLNNGSNAVDFTYGSLTLNGYIEGTGSLKVASANTEVTVGGDGDGGTLTFSTPSAVLKKFVMQKNTSSGKITLGSDVTTQALTLTRGIVATSSHKFIYDHSKLAYTAPASSYDSWICTCNSDGSPVSITTPFDGSAGFQLINVQQNRDAWFPVGADLTSPNRMYLKNTDATTDNYTVVVGKGDVINTPLPRVNRIWYVKNTSTTAKATMRLYFTKRDWTGYPYSEDEVESGFLYTDIHLVQETYDQQFINNSNGADVRSFVVADGSEIYGQYTKGVSADLYGATNGINGFTRFSVVNADGIVLPLGMTDFSVSKSGDEVQLRWRAFNRVDMHHFEIERAADGVNFSTLATVSAESAGAGGSYAGTDMAPLTGKNYYRVKAFAKNGTVSYTDVRSITIDGTKPTMIVYPNPISGRLLQIRLRGVANGDYTFVVYDNRGRTMSSGRFNYNGTLQRTIPLPARCPAGAYYVIVYNNSVRIQSIFMID